MRTCFRIICALALQQNIMAADADTILNAVELDSFSSISSDIVITSEAFGTEAYAGWKGSVAETTAHGLAAL